MARKDGGYVFRHSGQSPVRRNAEDVATAHGCRHTRRVRPGAPVTGLLLDGAYGISERARKGGQIVGGLLADLRFRF
jgi:hypothetical protein